MLGNLNNKVYLFPSDTKFSYQLDKDSEDDNDAIITSISPNNALLLNVDYANFTESSAIDSRFSFNNSLTIRLNQTKTSFHSDILQLLCDNPYYIGFENTEGQLFVLSPEYTASFNFTYTIENESSYLEVVFNTDSNMTAMWVASSKPTITKEYNSKGCSYKTYHVKKLEMGCTDDIAFEGNKVWMTHEGAIKTINFIKNTVTVIDSDTNGYEEIQLQFSIPYDNYKYYFHYNLLEFIKNTYSCIVYTDMGNCIFLENLFPSYKINTSESEGVLNTIQFTLTALKKDNAHVGFDSIDEDDIDKEENDNVTYAYVGEYDMCINSYEKAHLLIAEIAYNGNLNGNYYCLEGYEAMFQNYNIIGTFTLADVDRFGFPLIYYASECSYLGGECNIFGLPSQIVFTPNNNSYTYIVQASCNFTITSAVGITITPTSGSANQSIEITITNTENRERISYVTITLSDGSSFIVTVIVNDEESILNRFIEDGFICSDYELDESQCSKWEEVTYSENDPTTYLCIDGNKYKKLVHYVSMNCDGNFEMTNEYKQGDLIEEDDFTCLEVNCEELYEIISGEYICEESNNCQMYQDVEYNPYDPSTYICENHNLYGIKKLYISENCDNVWEYSGMFSKGDLIKEDSENCGYKPSIKIETLDATISGSTSLTFQINYNIQTVASESGNVSITLDDMGLTQPYQPINCQNMFNRTFNNATDYLLTLESFPNEVGVLNCFAMFFGQSKLTSVNLSYMDISLCDNISNMFNGCSSLETIYFDGWTKGNSSIKTFNNIENAFNGCTNLKNVYMRECSDDLKYQIKSELITSGINPNIIES